MPFEDELRRHGPGAAGGAATPDEARAYCARLTATHYENFSVATLFTPPRLRPAFEAVYAFCRWSDDLGDEVGDRDRARGLLAWWRGELHAMFAGQARHPVMVALRPIAREYAIPIRPFDDLIAAFEQDQDILQYDTFGQLLDYCGRSANPVGRIVLHLGRCFDDDNAALSDRTCTGLQLANFWQDVARDLAIGRIYLPREDRDRFGYPDADLRALRFTPAFADLLRFEVDRARSMLREGWPLAARMPGRLAIDVDLFTRGGLAILDRIERRGYDVLSARPEVGKPAKAGLLIRAAIAAAGRALRPAPASRPAPLAGRAS